MSACNIFIYMLFCVLGLEKMEREKQKAIEREQEKKAREVAEKEKKRLEEEELARLKAEASGVPMMPAKSKFVRMFNNICHIYLQ